MSIPHEFDPRPPLPSLTLSDAVDAIEASIPLESVLRAASSEANSPRVERVFAQFATRIEQGELPSAVLGNADPRLPRSLSTLIQAAMRCGKLPESLRLWAAEQADSEEMRRELRSSVLYPTVIMVATLLIVVIIAIMFGQVFESIYNEFAFKRSWQIHTAIWISHHGGMFLVSLVVAILATMIVRLLLGAERWSSLLCGIPLIGNLWLWFALARWANWLALFLDTHMPMAESLRLAGNAAGDFRIALASQSLAARIERGESLSSAMADAYPWPATASLLVHWGEQTASLPESLRGIARVYEGRLRLRRRWIRLVVPLLGFLLVGFAVLFAYTLLLSPITSLSQIMM